MKRKYLSEYLLCRSIITSNLSYISSKHEAFLLFRQAYIIFSVHPEIFHENVAVRIQKRQESKERGVFDIEILTLQF